MWNDFFDFVEYNYRDSISLLWYGVLFIAAGLVILLFPQILVALIAAALFLTGAVIITIAWQIKRSQNRYREIKINIKN